MSTNSRIRLFVHYTISLSSSCKLICRHWTYENVCQIYVVEYVSKIEHILLVIHYSIHEAVCFQFTQFPRDDWDNILFCLIIIIIISEVWTVIHCLGLGHETMVCAVCLFIFIWHLGHIRFPSKNDLVIFNKNCCWILVEH